MTGPTGGREDARLCLGLDVSGGKGGFCRIDHPEVSCAPTSGLGGHGRSESVPGLQTTPCVGRQVIE